MTALILAPLLLATVLVSGLAGAPIVRKAAPALMRTPRLADGALFATLVIWMAGFAALGAMFAWVLSGPGGLLPGDTGLVCQRCLDAANPLPPGLEFDTFIPVILLLALPQILVQAMSMDGFRYPRRHEQEQSELQDASAAGATADPGASDDHWRLPVPSSSWKTTARPAGRIGCWCDSDLDCRATGHRHRA